MLYAQTVHKQRNVTFVRLRHTIKNCNYNYIVTMMIAATSMAKTMSKHHHVERACNLAVDIYTWRFTLFFIIFQTENNEAETTLISWYVMWNMWVSHTFLARMWNAVQRVSYEWDYMMICKRRQKFNLLAMNEPAIVTISK